MADSACLPQSCMFRLQVQGQPRTQVAWGAGNTPLLPCGLWASDILSCACVTYPKQHSAYSRWHRLSPSSHPPSKCRPSALYSSLTRSLTCLGGCAFQCQKWPRPPGIAQAPAQPVQLLNAAATPHPHPKQTSGPRQTSPQAYTGSLWRQWAPREAAESLQPLFHLAGHLSQCCTCFPGRNNNKT